MKVRITITDDSGKELAGHMFEIAGPNDYQQAANYMWDRLRPAIAGNEPSSESHTWREVDQLPGDERG